MNTWREEVGRHLMRLDFEPLHDEPFQASVEPLLLYNSLRLTQCKMGRGQVSRNAELAKHGDPSHTLLIADRRLSIIHRGQDVTLQRGEATIFKDFEPGSIGGDQGVHFTALTLLDDGSELWADFDRSATGWRIPRNHKALALLKSYIGILLLNRLEESEFGLIGAAGRQLRDLAGLAIAPVSSTPHTAACDARPSAKLAQVLVLIERHARNPELSPDMVANELGISRRYLFRLLETSGASFSERVVVTRLAEASRLLLMSGVTSHRIGEIALSVGFSDISYFNRRFREYFGMSPSEVRNAGSQAEGGSTG